MIVVFIEGGGGTHGRNKYSSRSSSKDRVEEDGERFVDDLEDPIVALGRGDETRKIGGVVSLC